MRKILVLFTIVLFVPLDSFALSNTDIPEWIKNNAKWWSISQISDRDFIKGLEYLMQKGILQVSTNTKVDSTSSEQIPSWLRNNASWWSQGLLSDEDFVKGIQYLTNNEVIRIASNTESLCSGNALCVTGKVERIVDGDTIYVEGYKIRLALTNTPERGESGFSKATEFTKKLCSVGSIAVVDQDDKQPYDVYDRVLGKVYCNDKTLNSELLYSGYANILTQYCKDSEFSNESWAQDFGCGESSNASVSTATKTNSEPTTSSHNIDCDPSYPDFCIPSPPPDLDCKDILQKRFTVLQPDPHRFDGDKDGIGCES